MRSCGWRRTAFALSCALLVGMAYPIAAQAAEFTPAQRKEIETIIKDYLTKNPDLMLDVLQAAQDKIKSDSRDTASAELAARHRDVFDDPDSPVAGNPKGDV